MLFGTDKRRELGKQVIECEAYEAMQIRILRGNLDFGENRPKSALRGL
jgi:hypothetical protein